MLSFLERKFVSVCELYTPWEERITFPKFRNVWKIIKSDCLPVHFPPSTMRFKSLCVAYGISNSAANLDTFRSYGVCEYIIAVWVCITLQIRKKHGAQNPFSFLIIHTHSIQILIQFLICISVALMLKLTLIMKMVFQVTPRFWQWD